jgi:hypothetical protein
MAKFKFHISIGKVGCFREEVVEVADEDLEGLSEIQREKFLDEELHTWLGNNCDLYYEEVE